jgi:hypothetical protein
MVIPGARYWTIENAPPTSILHNRHQIMQGDRVASVDIMAFGSHNIGIPNLDELSWVDWIGGREKGSHLFFAPISPTTGEDAKKLWDVFTEKCKEAGFDPIIDYVVGWREMRKLPPVCRYFWVLGLSDLNTQQNHRYHRRPDLRPDGRQTKACSCEVLQGAH